MCVGVRGGGLQEYVCCCDNLYYGFSFLLYFNLVCMFISLNAFHVAPMFDLFLK